MNSAKKIDVSVCVMTYNQEKYIGLCLESLVNQKTDFNFEVIVGDDCSTDSTAAIVSNFQKKYPDIVKPILHKKNTGGIGNYVAIREAATGTYIANVDGDDWCAPNKLDTQIRFLNENPSCSAVCHLLSLSDPEGHLLGKTWPKRFDSNEIDIHELFRKHPYFGHSSLMYRQSAIQEFTDRKMTDFIDFHVYIALALKGKIGLINEKLGFYRMDVGISKSKNLYAKAVSAITYAKESGVSEDEVSVGYARQYFVHAKKALSESDYLLFKELIANSIRYAKISRMQIFLFNMRNNQYVLSLIQFLNRIRLKL